MSTDRKYFNKSWMLARLFMTVFELEKDKKQPKIIRSKID